MATKRLTMTEIKEILRHTWALGRSHRDVARSLGVSAGMVGTLQVPAPRVAGVNAVGSGAGSGSGSTDSVAPLRGSRPRSARAARASCPHARHRRRAWSRTKGRARSASEPPTHFYSTITARSPSSGSGRVRVSADLCNDDAQDDLSKVEVVPCTPARPSPPAIAACAAI
jgi:hypothetical protein